MSFSRNIIFFFILSSIALKTTSTFGARIIAKDNDDPIATVYIITDPLPENNTNPREFKIQVSNAEQSLSRLEATLKWGEDYDFVVEKKITHYLEAFWGLRFIASVHAFEPKRDNGHKKVFWWIKPNGFFLSWDNSTWVKKGVWETE